MGGMLATEGEGLEPATARRALLILGTFCIRHHLRFGICGNLLSVLSPVRLLVPFNSTIYLFPSSERVEKENGPAIMRNGLLLFMCVCGWVGGFIG